jgi:hypothetical protein
VADHALADQIAVLVSDLVGVLLAHTHGDMARSDPDRCRDITERARMAVRAARLDLDRPRPWKRAG